MNTKSIISVALATALLGAASCNSEDDKDLLGSVADGYTPHLITFNASAEAVGNSLQKASYQGDCVFTWTEGDEVNMFNSTDPSLPQPFTVTKVMDGYDYCQIQGMGTGKGDYYSIYPYQADATFDFTGLTFQNVEMPAVQQVSAGQFDPKADLLVAKADEKLNLAYHRIGAKMGITVPVADVKEIRITANTAIAGKLSVSADGQTISNLTDASNTISLTCDGGFVSGGTYYACLLPVDGSLEISITLIGADGKAISYASPKLSAIHRNDRIEAQPGTDNLHDNITVTLADINWWDNVPNTATKVVFDYKSNVADVSSMTRKALVADGQIGIYVNNGSEYYILSENDFEICLKGILSKGSTGMFCNFKSLGTIEFNNFNTSNVTEMVYMFYHCSSLTELNLDNFNTEKVRRMNSMFSDCSSLTKLDLSKFKTGAVTDMAFMFSSCSSLVELNLDGFNTEAVTDMMGMFFGCSKLAELKLDNFNTKRVFIMGDMFHDCSSLKTIYVSDKFTTDAETKSTNMFFGCTALEGGMGTTVTETDKTYAKIDKPGQQGYFTDAVYVTLDDIEWATNVLQTATKVVFDTKENQSANVSGIEPNLYKKGEIGIYKNGSVYYILSENNRNICMVGSLEGMFKDYGSLTSIEFANFNTEYVDNMSYMFNNCSALTVIYATDNFTTGSVKSSSAMFRNCSSLKGGNGYKPAVWTLMSADKTYAIIDGKDGKKGLFTDIAAKQ